MVITNGPRAARTKPNAPIPVGRRVARSASSSSSRHTTTSRRVAAARPVPLPLLPLALASRVISRLRARSGAVAACCARWDLVMTCHVGIGCLNHYTSNRHAMLLLRKGAAKRDAGYAALAVSVSLGPLRRRGRWRVTLTVVVKDAHSLRGTPSRLQVRLARPLRRRGRALGARRRDRALARGPPCGEAHDQGGRLFFCYACPEGGVMFALGQPVKPCAALPARPRRSTRTAAASLRTPRPSTPRRAAARVRRALPHLCPTRRPHASALAARDWRSRAPAPPHNEAPTPLRSRREINAEALQTPMPWLSQLAPAPPGVRSRRRQDAPPSPRVLHVTPSSLRLGLVVVTTPTRPTRDTVLSSAPRVMVTSPSQTNHGASSARHRSETNHTCPLTAPAPRNKKHTASHKKTHALSSLRHRRSEPNHRSSRSSSATSPTTSGAARARCSRAPRATAARASSSSRSPTATRCSHCASSAPRTPVCVDSFARPVERDSARAVSARVPPPGHCGNVTPPVSGAAGVNTSCVGSRLVSLDARAVCGGCATGPAAAM